MIQWMLAIWSLVPLPFLKSALTSGSSWFTYCWSLAWRILSITLLACEMSAIVWEFEHSLPLPFFGIGMKTDRFQSCGHCWVVQICWHIECSTFTVSSFRFWNRSTGIPSPSLALFVVMLSMVHLTSHSRMSALGEWSHHCDYLACEDLFCYSVYSCHLFLMSSASVTVGCQGPLRFWALVISHQPSLGIRVHGVVWNLSGVGFYTFPV